MMTGRPQKRAILFSVKLNKAEAETLQAVADSLQRSRGDAIRQLIRAAADVLLETQTDGAGQ